MKKCFLNIYFFFLFFCTDIRPQDSVISYLTNDGARIVLQMPFLFATWYLTIKRIMGRNKDSYTAKPKDNPSISKSSLNQEVIQEAVRKRGFKGKYTLVLNDQEDLYKNNKKEEIDSSAFVTLGSHPDDPVVLCISSTAPLHILHHEIGHMLQSQRRNCFWYDVGLPVLACIGIRNFLNNHLPDQVWLRLALAPLMFSYTIIRSRVIEGEADDLIPNENSLLENYKDNCINILEERKNDYKSSINEGNVTKRIGKTVLQKLFPESVGFRIFEALFIDPKHPGIQYSINRFERRIDGTLDTTPKPAKPLLLDNASFRVAETTAMTYGLTAHTLYTFTGAEKTLQIMMPLTEKFVHFLGSKAFDALQNKVSKKISPAFKN